MKYYRSLVTILLCSIPALSLGQIGAPRVGLVRYANGGVYPIFGLQANYVVGDRLFDRVNALSFSDAGGMMSRGGDLLLLNADLSTIASFDRGASTPPEAPIVGIDGSLTSAIAWLPSCHTLVHWNGSTFVPVVIPEASVNGEVFSVSKVGTDTAILVTRSPTGIVEENTVSLQSGTLVARTTVPGAASNVYRQGNFAVSMQNGQLVTTSAVDGSRKSVPIRAEDISFERMSATCVHLHAAKSGRDWLLHLSGGQSWLFELPMPAAEAAATMVAQ